MGEEDITTALHIAAHLIEHGAAVFAAPPCPAAAGGTCGRDGHGAGRVPFHLPKHWQLTVPSAVWLDPSTPNGWRPGWALGMVGGRVTDMLDADVQHGGFESLALLAEAGEAPLTFGTQDTPSGGRHHLIAATGLARSAGWLPGLDLQGGTFEPNSAGSHGRGFAYIAPTVKRSKVTGELQPYRWTEVPDLSRLAAAREVAYASVEGIRRRVRAHRAGSAERAEVRGALVSDARGTNHPFVTASQATSQLFGSSPGAAAGAGTGERVFSPEQARAYCVPALDRLRAARVGEIEDRCNAAAVQLAHFVPAVLTADGAMLLLRDALSATAYDEAHPASQWTVEKFRPVLDGRRPPGDNWKATLRAEIVDASSIPAGAAPPAGVDADAVDALLAEMLTLEEVKARPAPVPLIKGLLNLNSLAWLIGPPGCRKSFVALDMAAHVAAGRSWQGFKVTQGRVIIVAAEGAGGLSKRVTAWEMTHGPLPAGVHVLPRPVQAGDRAAWAVLVAACGRLLAGEPGVVVLDTQARVTVGLDENDATDMGLFIEAAEAIKRVTDACVLVIHHTGRKGGDARGSSAIDGAQDTELKVVKGEGLAGELLTEKQKDLDERAAVPLKFVSVVVGVDEDGDPVTSLALTADPFVVASGAAPVPPEAWEIGYGPMQREVIKVLRDQGRTVGLTKSETFSSVLERFHPNAARRAKESSFRTAWARVLELRSAAGDPVAVNRSGEKWIVDEDALAGLEPGSWVE